MAKRRTVVLLEQEQWESLQAMSESTGAPISELVRRSIDAMLAERIRADEQATRNAAPGGR